MGNPNPLNCGIMVADGKEREKNPWMQGTLRGDSLADEMQTSADSEGIVVRNSFASAYLSMDATCCRTSARKAQHSRTE